MEEDETFESFTDCYSEKLTSCVAACISYHPERRPDAIDLVRFTASSKSGDNSNSLSQQNQTGSPPVQNLSKTRKTNDPTLATIGHSTLHHNLHSPLHSHSVGTPPTVTYPDWMMPISSSPESASTKTQGLLGSEHLNTLLDMEKHVMKLCRHHKYKLAEDVYRQMLEHRQRTLGYEHADTLSSMHNLAGTLKEQREYKSAEEVYRQVLEFRQKVLGPEHPNTLNSMHGLAWTLAELRKYRSAEQMYRQVLKLRQKVLGPEYQDTLSDMHRLAPTLAEQAKYDSAEEMYRQVLELRQKALGPAH